MESSAVQNATYCAAILFRGESVEVDAIPPEVLRNLVQERLERHVTSWELRQLLVIEERERQTLSLLADEAYWSAS